MVAERCAGALMGRLPGSAIRFYRRTMTAVGPSMIDDTNGCAPRFGTACDGELGRLRGLVAAARSARSDLVEALLLGREHDDGEVERWAAHLGHDGRPHAVVTVALAGGGSAADHPTAEAVVLRWTPEAIVAARHDEIVVLLPVASEQGAVAELAGRWVEDLGRRGITVAAVGIGNAYHRAADIARSYGEARGAMAAARRTGSAGRVALFRDLGINRLLLRVPDVGELRAFGEEVIGRLLDEEAASGMPYLATLVAYFEECSSPSGAARRLHVHPNTIAYRLRRIEELTGLRLSVHRDRLMAEVAVEIVAGMGRG